MWNGTLRKRWVGGFIIISAKHFFGAELKIGGYVIILRTLSDGSIAPKASDQLRASSEDEGRLEHSGLAAPIGARDNDQRVRAPVRTAKVQVESIDPAKVAD